MAHHKRKRRLYTAAVKSQGETSILSVRLHLSVLQSEMLYLQAALKHVQEMVRAGGLRALRVGEIRVRKNYPGQKKGAPCQ